MTKRAGSSENIKMPNDIMDVVKRLQDLRVQRDENIAILKQYNPSTPTKQAKELYQETLNNYKIQETCIVTILKKLQDQVKEKEETDKKTNKKHKIPKNTLVCAKVESDDGILWIKGKIVSPSKKFDGYRIEDLELPEDEGQVKIHDVLKTDIIVLPKTIIDWPKGTRVRAVYPQTTVFYPAVVVDTSGSKNFLLQFEDDADEKTGNTPIRKVKYQSIIREASIDMILHKKNRDVLEESTIVLGDPVKRKVKKKTKKKTSAEKKKKTTTKKKKAKTAKTTKKDVKMEDEATPEAS
mmetsp:Transcript_9312/g.13784  ORF Transcript_9312/g.13784 Transcript_9312/m.13784 type:complete len:295 (-) Transcript_9312:55-939(-)|eukprot:CAMPEP_0117428754 /NCGR_PEP_ID=MMETSP0758-20121206/8388_1 /TAXON_ID=63605 /ORGANISM="Percolomonas cosmopolitus, Strain AE-1 (ATCC 50343)" /LENGTH=294 /DNA_ID=CAMNT_0005215279 /DNA_START=31 /DNA_END=915 /DNA_ORIENTATION=-